MLLSSWLVLPFSKKARREALRAKRPPEAWCAIVDKNVPYAAWLGAEDRRELWALVQIFLAEKRFEGCGGLSITDEMRVTIAAQACLLLLHRPNDVYPGLETILVYPHPYRARAERRAGPVLVESDDARLGESWTRGVVVLAWDHVRGATHAATDGHNLVIHEFAHQLDAEDGPMNGAPPLDGPIRYESWAKVLGAEFAALSERLRQGRASDVDPYGATSPAEFFAVVTEMFFDRPTQLARRHPELYGELVAFYRQDPVALQDGRATTTTKPP
jgi:Mlc titration factor MtfA (ptsG expression regulator)